MSEPAAQRNVIGIDLGGTKLAAGVIGGDLSVAHNLQRPSTGLSQNELIELILGTVEELVATCSGDAPVEAVGLGIPSLIDQQSGSAVMSVNLPLAGVPIRDLVQERSGLPVALDNDGNVAALAEQRFGAARGKQNVVMISVGTGIAGGIVIDGKVFRGSHGSGAELGHVTLVADGPPCQGSCPNRGCWETMASGTAIGRYAREAAETEPDSALGRALAAGREIDGTLATEAAKSGDAVALALLERAGKYLGAGLVGVVNVFNPETVVIGGGAAAGAGELLLEPARRELEAHALSPNKEQAPVVAAQFGGEAAMLGAAATAFIECLDEPLEVGT
jgi:glucokinase